MNVPANKKKIIFFFILVLLVGSYFGFKKIKEKNNKVFYVLSRVEKGTLFLSVSGSGQISTSEQIDLRPKVSGEVEEIFIKKDQKVRKGELLLKLKTKDFERAIEDGKLALEEAEKNLEDLKRKKEDSERDLKDSFESALDNLSLTFNELSRSIELLEPIFTKSTYDSDQSDIDYYRGVVNFYLSGAFIGFEFKENFLKFKEKYQSTQKDYLSLSRNSPPEVLEEWLKRSSNLVKEITDFLRKGRETISFYKEKISSEKLTPPISLSVTESQFQTISSILQSLDQKYSLLLSSSKTIDQLQDSILNLKEKIELQEKTIKQRKDNLEKAKENYENCFIYSPFDGKISKVNIEKGDLVTPSTVLFSLISEQKIAEISLNEIDVAKVRVGQKAKLTLDAIPNLILSGTVTEIDPVGTISQGVVSYGVKISLDSDDERIKPSMSVTGEIIIETKNEILILPNNAIKSERNLKYVEIVEAPEEIKRSLKVGPQISLPKEIKIKKQNIEIGLSTDNYTEIVSGLKEGDIVIASKISPKSNQTKNLPEQLRFPFPGTRTLTPRMR